MKRLFLLSCMLFLGAQIVQAAQPRKRSSDHVRGKELWERSCWQCHGEEARGDGPAADSITGGVPDLEGQVTRERFNELIDTIMTGQGAMPAFSLEFERPDAKRILIYLERQENRRNRNSSPEDDSTP